MAYEQPLWYKLALQERGVLEGRGDVNNPVVQKYYKDAGFPEVQHDSVPWCMAFVNAMLHRAGYKRTGSLLARSSLKNKAFKKLLKPTQGCIIVLERSNSTWLGHTGFFVRSGWMIGGNQSDMVSIARYDSEKLLGWRWPIERTRR